jgi:hypothetical protein
VLAPVALLLRLHKGFIKILPAACMPDLTLDGRSRQAGAAMICWSEMPQLPVRSAVAFEAVGWNMENGLVFWRQQEMA